MTPTAVFTCSICGEPSVSICSYCTKDACPNHLCDRCGRCSDCCECDIRLEEHLDEHVEIAEIAEEPVASEPITAEQTPVAPLSAEQWTQPETTPADQPEPPAAEPEEPHQTE